MCIGIYQGPIKKISISVHAGIAWQEHDSSKSAAIVYVHYTNHLVLTPIETGPATIAG
jgi:hypothetical protein